MVTVLVAGGAGYVGAHTCLRLAEAGFEPVVFDNLSNGRREFVQWGPFEEGDIRDRARLDEVLERHRPSAILHFAGLIEVGESVKFPERFHDNNVRGALNLIAAGKAGGVRHLVFSSSSATYGEPVYLPMDEAHPLAPLNPYGETKLIVERALRDMAGEDGFESVALRYFNAAGAEPSGQIGEAHDPETHAIPLAIDAALGRRPGFKIFGGDYATRDGTALRDYVHVLDLADAHVMALRYLMVGGPSDVFNLGAGQGTTVREMLDMVRRVSGADIPNETVGRRKGDAPALVANAGKAAAVLGWRPGHSLESIVESAWRWHASDHLATARASSAEPA